MNHRDSAVGKSCLLSTFASLESSSDKKPELKTHQPTIGSELFATIVQIDVPSAKQSYSSQSSSSSSVNDKEMISVKTQLQIWDTAGQERYRAIAPGKFFIFMIVNNCSLLLLIDIESINVNQLGHYRRATGALLVYDITRPETLEHACNVWLKEIDDYPDVRENVMLVGTKFDLVDSKDEETKKSLLEMRNQACKENHLAGSIFTSALTGNGVQQAFMTLARQALINTLAKSALSNQKNGQEYDETMSLHFLQQDALVLSAKDAEQTKKAPEIPKQSDPCGFKCDGM